MAGLLATLSANAQKWQTPAYMPSYDEQMRTWNALVENCVYGKGTGTSNSYINAKLQALQSARIQLDMKLAALEDPSKTTEIPADATITHSINAARLSPEVLDLLPIVEIYQAGEKTYTVQLRLAINYDEYKRLQKERIAKEIGPMLEKKGEQMLKDLDKLLSF